MPRFPLTDWQAEQARLTVFPMPDATTRSADWWQTVTDSQPDETTMNPKKGSGLIQGAFGPGKLILRLEPDRIDWVLAPPERDQDELAVASEFPILGPAVEMVSAFSAIAEKWLARDDLPAIARIAFGAVLNHPETDRGTGYLRLPDYVPVRVNPESSDFLYQVNLPTVPSATGIEGLRLNRLSKWSVAAWKGIALRITGTAVQTQSVPAMFALRVELDINTVSTFTGPIPRARLGDIYRELVAAGQAIAADGVVAQ
ncbi:MAG: hypothetical protein AAB403_00860 [Planctomycetota bacterium]